MESLANGREKEPWLAGVLHGWPMTILCVSFLLAKSFSLVEQNLKLD